MQNLWSMLDGWWVVWAVVVPILVPIGSVVVLWFIWNHVVSGESATPEEFKREEFMKLLDPSAWLFVAFSGVVQALSQTSVRLAEARAWEWVIALGVMSLCTVVLYVAVTLNRLSDTSWKPRRLLLFMSVLMLVGVGAVGGLAYGAASRPAVSEATP